MNHLKAGHQNYKISYFLISGDNSRSTEEIAKHLKFNEYYIGIKNKQEQLNKLLLKYKLNINQIMYIGDDINDLDIIENNKIYTACPNDAINKVKNKVNYISLKNGGDGAVRDIIEHVIIKGFI